MESNPAQDRMTHPKSISTPASINWVLMHSIGSPSFSDNLWRTWLSTSFLCAGHIFVLRWNTFPSLKFLHFSYSAKAIAFVFMIARQLPCFFMETMEKRASLSVLHPFLLGLRLSNTFTLLRFAKSWTTSGTISWSLSSLRVPRTWSNSWSSGCVAVQSKAVL